MAESTLPVYVLKRFVEGMRAQVGMDALKAVFEKADLPTDWVNPAHMPGLDEVSAAQGIFATTRHHAHLLWTRRTWNFISYRRHDVGAGFE